MSDESDFGYGFFWGCLCAIAASILIVGVSGVHMAGTDAYCAALGGEPVTYGVCNVDGKVVEMP